MSYIGNQPQYTAFLSDTFSGNGSTTVFTMAVAPANTAAVLVAISGVLQAPATYGVVGRILTFSQAPPSGADNISVRYLALPASNVTSTAYRSVTEFTATAGQTTFTPASYTPGFINVFRSGVRLGASNFTATNGVTVVLANAAAAEDLITIESFFVSSVLNAIPNVPNSIVSSNMSPGSVNQASLDTATLTGTGAVTVPAGNTLQRPTGISGMFRLNTQLGSIEFFDAGSWKTINIGYTVEYLVVAGGGAGGNNHAGGGGGGGYRLSVAGESSGGNTSAESPVSVVPGVSYSIVVGAGGTASGGGASNNTNGGLSTFGAITSLGGGAGGNRNDSANTSPGQNGGSGGGGGGAQASFTANYVAGLGTTGQGFAGGTAVDLLGGGGGGAGGVGQLGTGSRVGGTGIASSITGSSVFRSGGGGGSSGGSPAAAGGNGGGGASGTGSGSNGTAGTPNTGGGGGGGGAGNTTGSGGGSGIVIIRYLGTARGTGGSITSVGAYTVHTFTSSGTFTA